MEQAQYHGYALRLELGMITEEYFTAKIKSMLEDERFAQKAKYLSKLFRDQADRPLDRAVFWTEYVMRHKEAKHLQSAGKDLNTIQYHSIDVLAFLAVVSTVAIILIVSGSQRVFRAIMRTFSAKGKAKSSKCTNKNKKNL